MTLPWPQELSYSRNQRILTVTYDNGEAVRLPAELLRVESPSAEVRGHGGVPKQILGGKAHVEITRIEPVGRYAARLVFSDGHDSGLYSWAYLWELGQTQDKVWQDYLAALAQHNLSRGV